MVKSSSYGSKRKRYAAPVGGLFAALALIGLVVLIVASVELTNRALDNTGERRKIEEIIRPLVMFDPPPFERATDIDDEQLLLYSMWAALMATDYLFDENQELTVPASDLGKQARNLFGPDVTLIHKTFGEFEYSFYYDEARDVYIVPTNVLLYTYSPLVETIEQEGDLFNVRVGYVPPTGATPLNVRQFDNPQPEKYMIYVVRRVGETYQIVAVRDVAEGQTHMDIGGTV
jgi:hypothetical protein